MVWPAMEFMHVNTVEIPVYWEQFEPEYGEFDYSVVDTLLDQARDENLHLVLLWFGTWKNGSNHYMPRWMKLDSVRYPNMIGSDGKYVDSPSPVAKDTLAADIRAFSTLMRHLKEVDPRHTVLMVQVENEPGTWGGVRDYSAAAQAFFNGAAPAEVVAAMGETGAEHRRVGGMFSARTRMNISTSGASRNSSDRSRPRGRRFIRCPCTSTLPCAIRFIRVGRRNTSAAGRTITSFRSGKPRPRRSIFWRRYLRA